MSKYTVQFEVDIPGTNTLDVFTTIQELLTNHPEYGWLHPLWCIPGDGKQR